VSHPCTPLPHNLPLNLVARMLAAQLQPLFCLSGMEEYSCHFLITLNFKELLPELSPNVMYDLPCLLHI